VEQLFKRYLGLIWVFSCFVGFLNSADMVYTGMNGDITLQQDGTLYGIASATSVTLPAGSAANIETYGTDIGTLSLNGGCLYVGGTGVNTTVVNMTSGTITSSVGLPVITFKDDSVKFGVLVTVTGGLIFDFIGNGMDMDSTGTLALFGNNILVIKNAQIRADDPANINDHWLSTPAGSQVYFENVKFGKDLYSSTVGDGCLVFSGYDNQFNYGFKLPAQTRIQTKYPFSGNLNLNNKTLILDSDLTLAPDGQFVNSSGFLSGLDKTILFSSNQTYTLGLTTLGSLLIDGQGHLLDMVSTGSLNIPSSNTLTLKNLILDRLTKNWWAHCDGFLVLDNVTLYGPFYGKMGQEAKISGTIKIGSNLDPMYSH